MGHSSCCVVNCKNNGKNSSCKFYAFPTSTWTLQQRQKWIAAVNRKNADGSPWHPKRHDTICSEHFIGGKKSDAEASPSYIPTLFPSMYRSRMRIKKDVVPSQCDWNDGKSFDDIAHKCWLNSTKRYVTDTEKNDELKEIENGKGVKKVMSGPHSLSLKGTPLQLTKVISKDKPSIDSRSILEPIQIQTPRTRRIPIIEKCQVTPAISIEDSEHMEIQLSENKDQQPINNNDQQLRYYNYQQLSYKNHQQPRYYNRKQPSDVINSVNAKEGKVSEETFSAKNNEGCDNFNVNLDKIKIENDIVDINDKLSIEHREIDNLTIKKEIGEYIPFIEYDEDMCVDQQYKDLKNNCDFKTEIEDSLSIEHDSEII